MVQAKFRMHVITTKLEIYGRKFSLDHSIHVARQYSIKLGIATTKHFHLFSADKIDHFIKIKGKIQIKIYAQKNHDFFLESG